MEKADGDQPQETQFWCNICRIGCASALNLQSHFMGFKHRQVEESLKNHGAEIPVFKRKKRQFSDNPEPAVAGQTLDDLLQACKETEPALGLEYVYEYHQDDNYFAYECRLCNLHTGLAHMFMHVVGAKHRIAYLSRHHSTLGIPSHFQVKSAAKNKKLRDACFTVEKTSGRKNINVIKGSFIPRTFSDGPLPPPALNYGTDKLKKMDFTTDDFVDIEVKPSVSEHVVTFRELKARHEEKLKEAQVSVESEYQDQDDQEQQGNEKDNEKDNKENGSDMEVCSMDLSERDPDEFFCNQELFDFLNTYKINKKEDVTFILKVTQKFSEVLVHHNKQLEEARKKALAEDEKRKAEELKLKPEVQLNVEEKMYRAEETQYTLERQRVVGVKRTAEEARRGAEALTLRVEEAKRRMRQAQQNNGMRQRNQNVKTRVRRRNRGNKKAFNAQQKALPFLTKRPNLNQRSTFSSMPSSKLNPGNKKTFNAQQKTWPLLAKGPTLNQKSRFSSTSSSKLNPDKKTFNPQQKTWPFIAKGPTLNQKSTFSSMSKLNPEQGPNYSSSLFPIPRFDKQQHVGEVGSSFVQSKTPQGAESNLVQYPIFRRPINKPQSSAPMSQNQWSNQMATSKRDGHFQSRAPFPHEMQQETQPVNSSRPFFPPEMNVPKDEATNAFFASIKNMEVSEVASTLNAIAAKNPAFRGIHVPSLVKYLNDTGKLKTPHSFRNLSK